MNTKHNCIYCKSEIDEDSFGWLYAIEEDETVSRAHTECMEIEDGLILNELDW